MIPTVKFLGSCMGVELKPRNPMGGDNHILFVVSVEDDYNWIEKMIVSSYWIDELIDKLQTARIWIMENAEPDVYYDTRQYGFKFKKD